MRVSPSKDLWTWHGLSEICQHEKPPANEITQPPRFTVSKQELHGKTIVSVTFFSGKFVPFIFFSTDSHRNFGCSTTLFIAMFLFADLWSLIKPRALVPVFFSSPNLPLFFFLGPVFALVLTQGLFSYLERFTSTNDFDRHMNNNIRVQTKTANE